MSPPAAVPRTTRLTSRAAVLAVVICAIALSLAYPVREYVAQRRQIDQLVAEQQMMQAQVKSLLAQEGKLDDPAYIEQIAGEDYHMCLPTAKCYVIEDGQSAISVPAPARQSAAPWYAKLWHSVEQANGSVQATETPSPGSATTSTQQANGAPSPGSATK
jgi:cell division protein FtsB